MNARSDAEKQSAEQPVVRQPYISKETMRPLARMIAGKLLAEGKYAVGMSGNVQPGIQSKPPEESLADDKDGNH
jgi:hypothetical protein